MLTLEWDTLTLFLYLAIIISTYFISFFIISSKYSVENNQINYIPLVIVFLILFIFSSIRNIGTDYAAYEEIFNASNNSSESSVYGIEPGFLLLNRFIRCFTSDSRIFFTLISFTTTLLVFLSLLRYKNIINFPFAIFVYSTLYYFQSYSLLRVYLASAILLFSFDFLIRKKYYIYFLFFLISSTIHYSTLLLLLPIFGLFLYQIRKYLFYFYIFFLFFFIYNFLDYLIIFNLTDRYTGYLESIDKNSSIGWGQIFLNFPILYIINIARREKIINNWFIDVTIVFTWFSFLFGTLGYWIPTISRANYLITFPFILFIPILLKLAKNNNKYKLIYTFSFVYFSTRLYIYFSALAFADGINVYYTIFNNK